MSINVLIFKYSLSDIIIFRQVLDKIIKLKREWAPLRRSKARKSEYEIQMKKKYQQLYQKLSPNTEEAECCQMSKNV